MPRLICVIAALALPVLARATPAKVRVFEAEVRASPDPAAPVVHTFAEGAAISVSEQRENGWRKVRLPDGDIGYVRDGDVALDAPGVAAAPPASPPAPASPDLRARIYVKDLDHFAELVKDDAVVAPQAEALTARWTGAKATWIASGIAAVALFVVGYRTQDCEPGVFPGDKEICVPSSRGLGMMGAAVGVGVAGGLAGALIAPKRDDLIDAVNAWNVRHPAEPFDLDTAHTRRHHEDAALDLRR